jgi:hypothetical protein
MKPVKFVKEHLIGLVVGILGYELYYRGAQGKPRR